MTDGEFFCTTVLEFEDCFEGQVLHIGDKESCKKVVNLTSAIYISDGRKALNSWMRVIPKSEWPEVKAGEAWRMKK